MIVGAADTARPPRRKIRLTTVNGMRKDDLHSAARSSARYRSADFGLRPPLA